MSYVGSGLCCQVFLNHVLMRWTREHRANSGLAVNLGLLCLPVIHDATHLRGQAFCKVQAREGVFAIREELEQRGVVDLRGVATR